MMNSSPTIAAVQVVPEPTTVADADVDAVPVSYTFGDRLNRFVGLVVPMPTLGVKLLAKVPTPPSTRALLACTCAPYPIALAFCNAEPVAKAVAFGSWYPAW